MEILQSFRYKGVNVIFTLPSAGYMDKVARELCHFVVNMRDRGVGAVYRIVKTPYQAYPFTPFMGMVYSEMPTPHLWSEFKRRHLEHIDEFVAESRELSEALKKKEEKRLKKALQTNIPDDELLRIAKVALPRIVNLDKDTDQGRVNVRKMKEIIKEATDVEVAHNRSYKLRDQILEHLHKDNDKVLKELRRKESRDIVARAS